jgi:regulator of sigma E protease
VEALITTVEFLAVLTVVVVVHEFGHFATAKAFGIKVHEFGVGFPPRLLGFRKGETVYTINLLPLGGFVRPEGENDPSQPRSLASKGIGTRFIVLVAGVVMNVVLGIVLLAAFYMFTVDDEVRTRVGEVAPGSPAEMAGVLPGDFILEVNGKPVNGYDDLANEIDANRGKEIEWTIQRENERQSVHLVPRVNPPPGEGATGINLQFLGVQRWTPTRTPWEAASMGLQFIEYVLVSTKNEISNSISEGRSPEFAGHIGIAQATGEATREGGLIFLLPLAGILSIIVGIANILPIPPLDGGKLFFIGLEWVRRGKRIPPEKEGVLAIMGIALMIGIAVALGYNDIMRILQS